jgi:hypothetical protein
MRSAPGCPTRLIALLAAAVVLNGCGGTSQTDVAWVAKEPITYPEFVHRYAVAVRQGGKLVPDPPTYTKCVAEIVATTPALKNESIPVVARAIKARRADQCARLQREYQEGAMQALISGKWASLAAKRAQVSLSSAEVQKAIRLYLRRSIESGGNGREESSPSPEALEAELGKVKEKLAQEKGKGFTFEEKKLEKTAQELAAALAKARVHEREEEKEYLNTIGLTMADLKTEVTTKLLYSKLGQKALKGVLEASKKISSPPPMTQAEVAAYYHMHLAESFRPKVREIELVTTSSLAKARHAKVSLEAGQSITQVNKRYAVERTPNSGRSTVTAPTKLTGDFNPSLTKAEFSSPVGQIVGPIRSDAGNIYFVLRVIRARPTHDTPLADATRIIRTALEGERQKAIAKKRKALEAQESKAELEYERRYAERWTQRTTCHKGYIVGKCSNASAAAKAAELPRAAKKHRLAIPAGPKIHGPLQTVKVIAAPDGEPSFVGPGHYATHPGYVKFEIVNNSSIPDKFGLEEAGEGAPAEYLEEFAEKTQSLVMKLEPGEYTIEALNEPAMKVGITVG